MKKLSLFLSICAFFCSCANNDKAANNGSVVLKLYKNVSAESINENFTLNEIFSDIEFIQLKENDKFGSKYPYIWSVNDDGVISFVDFSNKQVVSVYDKDGNIVSTFSKNGKGDGEFLYAASVNHINNQTIVYGSTERKIFTYDIDGNIASQSDFPAVVGIFPLGDDKFLCRANEPYNREIGHNLLIIDRSGQVLEKFLPADTTSATSIYFNPKPYAVNGNCEFSVQTFGSIKQYSYNVAENKLKEIFSIDLGEYAPQNYVQLAKLGNFEDIKVIFAITPVQLGDYIFINYIYNSRRYYDIWSYKDAAIIARRSSSIYEQSSNYYYITEQSDSLALELNSFTNHNNILYSSIFPTRVKNPEAMGIDPDGNIVITKFKLKN